jgi:Holliday junction DNA helicase RuvB
MANENALRPQSWDTYIGQEKVKDRLQISIDGAINRNDPLDHVLLYGEPGCGKTSLAALISQEMKSEFVPMVMPVKVKALAKVFMEPMNGLATTRVIFLDEIHRLSKKDQEFLLPVLEDHEIQFENGKKFQIPGNFTVVGATTELERIIRPLRDRFIHKPKFDDYTDDEMADIVERMARRISIFIPRDDAISLGRASAGVPRQARTLVFTARDLGTTDPEVVLETCGISAEGLTEDHMSYLEALDHMGQVAGVDVLTNYTGQPKDVLLDLEKLLVRKRYIEYTPKGRSLMVAGMKLIQSQIQ